MLKRFRSKHLINNNQFTSSITTNVFIESTLVDLKLYISIKKLLSSK